LAKRGHLLAGNRVTNQDDPFEAERIKNGGDVRD
jgi:hypothetical protein